jgi:hypothetical protein
MHTTLIGLVLFLGLIILAVILIMADYRMGR